jgi:hypothetical protein
MAFYQTDTAGNTVRIDINTDGSLTVTSVSSTVPTTLADASPALTGQSLVKRALRLIGAVQTGESPTAVEQVDALEALNAMLDAWNAENLMLYSLAKETFTLQAGHDPHTVGSGGDLSTVRPQKLEAGAVYVTSNSSDYPVEVISQERYAAIPLKTTQGLPYQVYYDGSFYLGNAYFYPVPDQAYTLTIYKPGILSQVGASTSFSLPPAYANAIVWNLAVELAAEWGVIGSKEIASIAAKANEYKSVVKRANIRPIEMRSDSALLNCNYFDIRTGRSY